MNRNPLPIWARIVAVALIFAGYGLLEMQDAHTDALIAKQQIARGK